MNLFSKRFRKFPITQLIILLFVTSLLPSCFFRGGSSGSANDAMLNYQEGNYIYEDNLIILSAKIHTGEMPGSYEYSLVIINNNISALPLNYYNDILTLNYQDKIYSLGKNTSSSVYPSSLEPAESTMIRFQIDGIFSDVVKDIKELVFKMGEFRYTLRRNPSAVWPE